MHRLEAELSAGTATHITGSGASTSGREAYEGLEGWAPKWLVMESNDWHKRVQARGRLRTG